MKVSFSVFLISIFVSRVFSSSSFSEIFSSKIISHRPIIHQFIDDILGRFDSKQRQECVCIIDDPDFSEMDGDEKWPSTLYRTWERNVNYLDLLEGRIFLGRNAVNKVLRNVKRSIKTKFVVITQRNHNDDKFFIDGRNQMINLDNVIKEEDIQVYFRKDVLEHGPRRSRTEFQIKYILQKFWAERVLNVVVAVPQKTKVYVYTYFPYTEINCAERIVPVLTNVWFAKSSYFYRNHEFFPEKTTNLFGCTVNVSLIVDPPAIIYENGLLKGIEGMILMTLFRFMNATPNFRFAVSSNESSSAMNNVLNDVRTGISDIGAGFLIPTSFNSGGTDCVYVSLNLCLTWAVPNRAKIKNAIAYIIETFTIRVWTEIFAVIIISSVFLLCLYRITSPNPTSFQSSARKIFLVLIGEPGDAPKEGPVRVFLISWICFSILMNEVFQAAMGSNNMIVQPRSQLDTIEDVVNSGFEIRGVDHAVQFLHELPAVSKSRQTKVVLGEIQDSLTKVGLGRRTIYVGFKLPMKYYKNVLCPELRSLIHIHRTCIVTYQPFFALRNNSPFSQRIRKLVMAMSENGFSDWLNNYFTTFDGSSQKSKSIEEVDAILFYGSFQIWLYGMFISFVAFLCECGYHRMSKNFWQKRA